MNENIYLSSGKFAELCGTTKETLRHYHNKGLLIPEKQEENGYFYYSVKQCLIFELISLLSQTGNSLNEIKEYLNNYNTKNFSVLMEKSYKNLTERKNKIEQMMRIVKNSADSVKEAKNKTDEIFIEECEQEYFWTFEIAPILYEDLNSFSKAVYNFRQFNKEKGFTAEHFYTSFISEKDFLKKTYLIKTIAVKSDFHRKYSYIKPKGEYAVIYHKGEPETIKNSLDKLNDFLKKKDLKISGSVYETEIINNVVTKDKNNYITKISVQIKK